ncbi:PAS domain-containing sensor histidine kinase [Roseivirga sp. BDSF3-8]|uniref:sensor histidine kinase n=1 Tax=Roseivirga sp. BDSF3-8 TaxID=3241598 RepID=UPI003531EDA3
MVFKEFRTGVLWRVLLIALSIFVGFLLYFDKKYVSTGVTGVVIGIQIYNLFLFVENTNRKLTRFLESVRYSDFVSGFNADNKLGDSFRQLNQAFNEVLDAFREQRSISEENELYLHTIVQHVTVGLLALDSDGNVELINPVAKRLLDLPQLKHINELHHKHPVLHLLLVGLKLGQRAMHRIGPNVDLAISVTELRLHGKHLRLYSLQNIRSELQQNEIQAWQNLTKVLRHEIMNSITPIASLVGTLNDILKEDLHDENGEVNDEALEDIQEGLQTIGNRSKGLVRFVDAYRDFTNIPEPEFTRFEMRDLLDHVAHLMRTEFRDTGISMDYHPPTESILLMADQQLIEMILINLIKNGREALTGRENGRVELSGGMGVDQRPVIQVSDNGPGIIPEARERIFIPFYTTKKTGSGIGLSLSRQIMQLHNGDLSVESEPEVRTIFTLRF